MCAHDEEVDTSMDDKTHSADDAHTNGKANGHGQPETMFDSLKVAAGDIAEKAGPTVRDLSARAADLTATAADKSAPYLRRAGAATADYSIKLAEAARSWAAELRGAKSEPTAAAETSIVPTATAVAEPPVAEDLTTDDLEPADFAAAEPQAVNDAAPYESIPQEQPASPAFEEGTGSDDEAERPGI
jgi:hypothetical protein